MPDSEPTYDIEIDWKRPSESQVGTYGKRAEWLSTRGADLIEGLLVNANEFGEAEVVIRVKKRP